MPLEPSTNTLYEVISFIFRSLGMFGVCETGIYMLGFLFIGHSPINPEGLAGKKPKVWFIFQRKGFPVGYDIRTVFAIEFILASKQGNKMKMTIISLIYQNEISLPFADFCIPHRVYRTDTHIYGNFSSPLSRLPPRLLYLSTFTIIYHKNQPCTQVKSYLSSHGSV